MKYRLIGDPLDFFRECIDEKTIICATGRVYDTVGFFINGYAIVEKDNKYGFINYAGDEICEIRYDYVRDFNEGVSEVMIAGEYGYINEYGYEICPPGKYDEPLYIEECGIICAWDKSNKLVLINTDGDELVDHIYEDISLDVCTENFFAVCQNGKWCFLDKSGVRICEPKFDKVDLTIIAVDEDLLIVVEAILDDNCIYLLEVEDEDNEQYDLIALVDGEFKTLDEI